MAKYILRRILWMFPVLIGISLITFVIMHLVPGGPWDREKQLAPAVIENLNRKYGLDDPLWKQYLSLVSNALHGDLGISYTYQDRSISSIILQGLPKTATIGLSAFVLALGIGIPLGMAAAIRQNTWTDYFAVQFATFFAAIPGFILAFLLIITFSLTFHLLPTGGWGKPQHIILPTFALAALPAAYIARISRASLLEVLRQDYIRTAYAKGLAQSVIYYRHALKNALIPVVTITGPELAALVTGSFIIEQVFSIPGVGRLFVQGVFQRDYGLLMGTVLFYAAVIALLNLLVDILYPLIDPRVRYD